MDITQKVKYLIENNRHMVIATANNAGKPWVSPVFYVYDKNFNLYWVSSKEAKHSENIKMNSSIAIVIIGESPSKKGIDGVYIEAEGVELADSIDLQSAVGLFLLYKQPDKFMIKSASDVTGNASWRIYKAIPQKIYKRAEIIDKSSNQTITVREEVKLKDLTN